MKKYVVDLASSESKLLTDAILRPGGNRETKSTPNFFGDSQQRTHEKN